MDLSRENCYKRTLALYPLIVSLVIVIVWN